MGKNKTLWKQPRKRNHDDQATISTSLATGTLGPERDREERRPTQPCDPNPSAEEGYGIGGRELMSGLA